MLPLPAAFTTAFAARFGPAELAAYREAMEQPTPTSIRLNPAKPVAEQLLPPGDPVPWHPAGRYLAERPIFTLDPVFQAGGYYPQEASSMFIDYLLRQLNEPARINLALDLCAAPGGKSTLLRSVLRPGAVLVANEVIRARHRTLRYNLAKWGLPRAWTTNLDPERFAPLAGRFDLVVVDAPCSGEGLFRRQESARTEWSPANVELCAARQRRILAAAVPLLRPGGLLLYSTCTYNAAENEDQLTYLYKEYGLTPETVDLPPASGIVPTDGGGYRFFPQHLRGEGFFAAALRVPAGNAPVHRDRPGKFRHWSPAPAAQVAIAAPYLDPAEEWQYFADQTGSLHALPAADLDTAQLMAATLGRIDFGLPLGAVKGKNLLPSGESALHTALAASVPRHAVDDPETMIRVLRGETPELTGLGRGAILLTYAGLGLAWVKGLGNRYNNNYPKGWRVRMGVGKE